MTQSALMILAPGFEEIEAITTVDILRRGGVHLTLASLESDLLVQGKQQVQIRAEVSLQNALQDEYDALILPGGPGTFELLKSELVLDVVQDYASNGKWLCAICAAPLILKEAGLLEDKHYTAHFSVAESLPHIQLNKPVIEDGNMITANGPAAAVDFALTILRALTSDKVANTVADDICYSQAVV